MSMDHEMTINLKREHLILNIEHLLSFYYFQIENPFQNSYIPYKKWRHDVNVPDNPSIVNNQLQNMHAHILLQRSFLFTMILVLLQPFFVKITMDFCSRQQMIMPHPLHFFLYFPMPQLQFPPLLHHLPVRFFPHIFLLIIHNHNFQK